MNGDGTNAETQRTQRGAESVRSRNRGGDYDRFRSTLLCGLCIAAFIRRFLNCIVPAEVAHQDSLTAA
jgi:hypothetical protein